jgi:tyrosine decarboxylase/aspartate 1-decarboxylase
MPLLSTFLKILSPKASFAFLLTSRGTALEQGQVVELLKRLREADPSYSRGEVLGSMTVDPPGYLLEAFKVFANTNLNDPKLFGTAHFLEVESVGWLSRLFYGEGHGFLTYGGTESNITALYILRELTGGEVIIAPKSVHFSIKKACKILRLHLIEVGLGRDYRPDMGAMCELIRKYRSRLAGVVLTAGTTELGVVEPVDELVKVCGDVDYAIHVDAAYGGLLAQALRGGGLKLPIFDFRVDKVCTVSVDLHKLVAPIPCGAILLRSGRLEELVTFDAPYMPSGKQRTLLGTRSGGVAAVAWAIVKALGVEGLRSLAQELRARALYLSRRLGEVGVEVIREPELPLVAFKVPDRDKVMEFLWSRKLYVYPLSIPGALRVVVGPHVTYEAIERLVDALEEILKP